MRNVCNLNNDKYYVIVFYYKMDEIIKHIDDILDTKAKNPNFMTNKQFSQEYKELAKKWSKLPMYTNKRGIKEFFELIHNCQVVLIISGTGSGKTVLIPKFFLKYVEIMGLGGKIVITNPKVLTTIYNAEYGAKTLDVKLGEEVGYRYKGSPSNASSSSTKLLYATDGLILATILSGDRLLSEYQGVIIDEAHERHIQIDLLLGLIKEILPVRPEFKLIIMSATINADVFKNYFKDGNIKFGDMEVTGESNYPIQQNWLDPKIKITRSNYMDFAIERCFKIIEETDSGDIIVFVATQKDAVKGCYSLKANCPQNLKTKAKKCNKLFCVEVFSKMKQKNKDLAVDKNLYKKKGYDRKVIFATNVAESSITFDGLVYVVDTGYELANYYDVNNNSYVISKLYTSQAQVKQRIGRAGRTQPGVSYHIYPRKAYDKFNTYPEPNISIVDLTDFVLSFISYSKTIKNIVPLIKGLITIPRIEQIVYPIYKLCFTKAIKLVEPLVVPEEDTETEMKQNIELLKLENIEWLKLRSYDKIIGTINGALTTVGLNILKFKSSTLLSALAIIMSKYLNCQIEIIRLMGIIDITEGKLDSLFDYDRKETDKVIKYFSKVAISGSDHLTILNIYKEHYLKGDTKYINKKSFDNIDKRMKQLIIYANSITPESYAYMNNKYNLIKKEPYTDNIKNMLYTLLASHYYNLLQKESKGVYTSLNFLENSVAPIEYSMFTPTIKEHSNFVICHSLVNVFGSKNYKCNTQIPDDIMNDFINNEILYFDQKNKFGKII